MIQAFLFALVAAVAFMVRDGWPGWRPFLDKYWPTHPSFLNPTELARVSGAVIFGLGALLVFSPLTSALLALVVLASYFTDQKHGEGQGPDNPFRNFLHNAPFLALSGVSSMLPLASYVEFAHHGPRALIVLAAGLLKVAIWPLCWSIFNPAKQGWFFEPTRLAAITFGFVTGVVAALLA